MVAGLNEAIRTLASGRLSRLETELGQLRAADVLVADIVSADASARVAGIGLAELRDLQERAAAEAPDRPLLRWWVVSMIGERAFLDTDLGVIPLAVEALTELPDEPFATLPVLYVRGRLRRIASATYLLAPSPDGMAEHLRLRDEAVADFRRGDLTAEVALTRGLSAAIHAISTWEDILEDLAVVRDARALLDDSEDSVWLPVLDELLALVALAAGDLGTADAAISAVERRRHLHPVFAVVAEVGRAEHDLMVTRCTDDAVAAVLAALDRMRAQHPQMLGLNQLRVANVLADHARTDDARAVGLAGLAWPPTNSMMAVAGALLRVRIGVLDGGTRDAEAALVLLDQLVELGHVRRAGAMALRMARDYARVEAADAAATLRAWGLERMPDERRRTPLERDWARPLDSPPTHPPTERVAVAETIPGVGAAAATGTGCGIVVRVLAPVLEISRDTVPVRLRSMPAKLLLALLVALPEPLHVEQAVDLLWPDATPGVGRPRLNTVVHRLRSALDLAPGTLRRVGDVLLLDPQGWDVDLLRFRDAARRGPPEALSAALAAMTGILCHVQFPYDDLLVDHRHALDAQVASARSRLGP